MSQTISRSTEKYYGQCYCGAVKFNVSSEPLFTQYCHCNKCREVASLSKREADKLGYNFTAAFLTQHFQITDGKEHLTILPRNNSNLMLCQSCNSLLYGISMDEDKQAGIGVNANNFIFSEKELPASFQPDKHIYYAEKLVEFDDELPKYVDCPVEQFGSGELFG